MVTLALAAAAFAVGAQEAPLLRHRAPIVIEQPAAFVRLPLPPAVYARSVRSGLGDLRVVDARGDRVPFALLAPRPDDVRTTDRWRDAALYRLPPRPAAGGTWPSPVDVTVDRGRITVRQRGAAPPAERSPGWLVDLGERAGDDPPPRTLRLQWSGPAEFSAAYAIEHSADLRRWARAPGAQVMALASPGGALTQPDVPLPPGCGRFVRIVWAGPGPGPALTGARAATPATDSVAVDPPVEIGVAATAEPAGPHAGDDAGRALHFDLGAVLPLARIDLQLPAGTRVLPVHVQLRERADVRWEPAAGAVFYRIERGDEVTRSAALALPRSARFVRLLIDERAAVPRADEIRLIAQARLASLVFAAQGEAPYTLLAGAAKASPGALPLATLVADPDRERPRFGRATIGEWTEVREAVAQAQAEERRAALRPWLLWAVLVAGVAGLGAMVWTLARGSRPPAAP
jgi:hypothetical protein